LAKEGFEMMSKVTSGRVLGRAESALADHFTKLGFTSVVQGLHALGKQIAEEGCEQIAKNSTEQGAKAFANEAVQATMRDVSYKNVDQLWKEVGLSKIVKEEVFSLLNTTWTPRK